MGDIKQTIRIEQITDVRQVLKSIDTIKDSLSKLAIGPETQASFNRFFAKIENQAERANEAMASGFKNKKDVNDFTDSVRQISTAYSDIITKLDILKSKNTPLKETAADFKLAGDQIKQLQKDIEKFKASLNDIRKETSMGVTVAAADQKFNQDDWKKIKENFTDTKVNIEEVEKALASLNKKYEQAAKNKWTEGSKAEEWERFRVGIKGVSDNLTRYKESLETVNDAQKGLNEAQNTYNQLQEKNNAVLNEASNAAEKDAQNFSQFSRSMVETAKSSQQLNSELEHFKSKAAYFFGIANGINLLKRAIRSAYSTVKDLDAVMTETAVVTDFDVGDMWAQLPEYTQRANELGVSIHSAYEAATIFYQQGLKTNEVMAVSNETLKMARIAGLDAATASDRMTNALRGFNMEMDKMSAQRVNDVYSKLAAITASNTDEISTAMTKVASLAHNANMEFETTAAFLAQIIESTRESAETAGTALKTVVARFSEVKKLYSKGELLGQDEEGEEIDVNKVSTALRSAGINLNEYLTGAKGLDDIFIELAEKWDSLDIVQQRYIATMAAGSRQQSRFIALMSDYKRTVELVDAANNANGASHEQYGKTLDSLETKLSRLKNAWNEFVLGLANSDAIKSAVDLLTGLLTAINKLISTISGKNSTAKMITTFFTAFSAFKIGKAAIGKNNTMTAFFGRLVGDSEVITKGSAGKIANSFYSNLATKIADFSKSGGFKGAISSSLNKGVAGINNYFAAPMTSNLRSSLFRDVLHNQGIQGLNPEQSKALQEALNKDTLSVTEFNQVMEKNGIQFQLNEQNAEKYNITMQKGNGIIGDSATTMRALSAAALAVGSAFMIIGSQLEKTDKFKTFGTIIKSLGTGLVVFGTIMSVYLPLQAQLMAKGVTSAIASIPIIGWIAAVISALVTLGTVIYNLEKDKGLEAKLERSSEAAKNAAKAADEAKDAYEELQNTWNNLDEKNKAIEEATKGTQEWRDAIKEVNNAVLELLNSYDGIVEIGRGENGALTIKNQKEIDDRLKSNSLVSQGAARISKIRTYEDEETKRKREYENSHYQAGDKRGYYYPAAEVLYNYSGKFDELQSKSDEEIKDLIKQTYLYQNSMHGVNYDFEEGIKEIRNYIKETENYEKKVEAERIAFGATILQNAGLDKNIQPYANTLVNEKYIAELTKNNQNTYEKLKGKKLQDEYAGAHNTTWAEMVKNNPELKEAKEEELRDYLATRDALNQSKDQLEIFAKNLDKLNEAEKSLYAEEEGRALTKTQYDKLNSEGYNKQALYTSLGGNAVYGEDGYKIFEEWFNNSIKAAADNFDTSSFSSEFVNRLNKDLIGGLTSGTFKNFVDNMWSVYSTSGAEGMKELQNSIAEMVDQVEKTDPDKVEDFMKSINSVDWASAESIKTLDDLAKEFGLSEEAVKSLEDQIIKLNNAAKSFDIEKITTALGLSKKIKNSTQGRSFSVEDYNTAIANGADKGKFVYNIETEKYDYIGQDIQDVRAAIEDQTKILSQNLEKENASNIAVGETIAKYGQPDSGKEGDIRLFLSRYIDAAGSNALFGREVLSGSFAQINEAYNKVMAAYFNRADTEERLGQANTLKYQLNSGAENAALATEGNEAAAKALALQIANSGLPEEFAQRFIEGINNGKENQTKGAGTVVDVFSQASQYGIDTETLNSYADALRQINGLENARIETLYALALANAKYQDGYKKVIESYDDWIKLKQEDGSIAPEDGNLEQLKAYEQLKKDLKEMFNLSKDVSDEFLKSAENVKLIEKAAKGDTKAVTQLRANLAKTEVLNSGKIAEGVKDDITKAIDDLSKNTEDLKFGATLDDSKFAQGLAETLQAAGVAGEEMQKIFESLGWSPEVTYESVDVADIQKTNTSGWQEIMHPDGTKERVPVNGLSEYAVDGKVRIPVIGKWWRK